MPGWYVSYRAGAGTVMSLAKTKDSAISIACDLLDRNINVQEISPLLGMRDPGDIIDSVEIRKLHLARCRKPSNVPLNGPAHRVRQGVDTLAALSERQRQHGYWRGSADRAHSLLVSRTR
jgi:hypothetical protein